MALNAQVQRVRNLLHFVLIGSREALKHETLQLDVPFFFLKALKDS